MWPGGVVVRALWTCDSWSRVPLPASRFKVTTLGKLFTYVPVPLSPSSIIWYTGQGVVMPRGWEGNRSGVALAMRRRLQWFILYLPYLPQQGSGVL